jgi:peptide/nickel transport system permease protein
MNHYLVRRLLLLPITLVAIIFVNFLILNLVPGDPVTLLDRSSTGEATRSAEMGGGSEETHHLQFREHYGLTKPILFNDWSSISMGKLQSGLKHLLSYEKEGEDISVQKFHSLKTLWGDRASYLMPLLIEFAKNTSNPLPERKLAANLFIRGGTKMGSVGCSLSDEKKMSNRKIADDNHFLSFQRIFDQDTAEETQIKILNLETWYQKQGGDPAFSIEGWNKLYTFFFDTRFFRYFEKVLKLDFGTLRNDSNKTVISEVTKRIKYSLTLAVFPMLITFVLCQIFGMIMAVYHDHAIDYILNIIFLILFAIPVFVVAPFLIEKIAMNRAFPFTNYPIPYSGFQSPEAIYSQLTSSERLGDIIRHLVLPLIAVMYGMLAVQARLSRTAFLEVLNQNHVKAAHAKGLPLSTILWKHVGRNGAVTIVTSLATSLGVILGGSLIVETVFEINGFGRFFYEAILNRDYNVVLFSAFAGSLLTLVGYLLADIAYTYLDPRVNFN